MGKNTEISERVKQLLDNLGVNPNEFAAKLGYARSQTIYDILNGKSSPSYDFFNKFLNSEYSEIINIKWLIANKGLIRNEETEKTLYSQVADKKAEYDLKDYEEPVINALERVIAAQDKTIHSLEQQLQHSKSKENNDSHTITRPVSSQLKQEEE